MTEQQQAGMTYVEADQVTGNIGDVLVADLALQAYDNWLAFRQSPRANNLLHDQFAAAGFARVFRMAGWAVTRYMMMRPDDLPRMDRAHFQHLLDAIAAGHVRYVENRYVDALPAVELPPQIAEVLAAALHELETMALSLVSRRTAIQTNESEDK